MADELILVYETHIPIAFLCANNATIEKGALLMLADPNTVATTTGDTDVIVGVAAEEKIINDGKTKIGVYQKGTFKGVAGVAGVTAGMAIISDTGTSSVNRLVVADVNSEHIVGRSSETATSGETFLFELNPFAAQLA